MQEWKQVVAMISIVVIVASMLLYLIMFGPVLDDPEFEAALQRGREVGIPEMVMTEEYPFSPIKRVDAVDRYIAAAQEMEMIVYSDDLCQFNDLEDLDEQTQQQVELACRYRFFLGNEGNFVPDGYLTKAGSIVALIRGMYPAKAFPEIDPYREPFVNQAFSMGITKRTSSPYLMYLVTRYELLLQLYRAAQTKKSGGGISGDLLENEELDSVRTGELLRGTSEIITGTIATGTNVATGTSTGTTQ